MLTDCPHQVSAVYSSSKSSAIAPWCTPHPLLRVARVLHYSSSIYFALPQHSCGTRLAPWHFYPSHGSVAFKSMFEVASDSNISDRSVGSHMLLAAKQSHHSWVSLLPEPMADMHSCSAVATHAAAMHSHSGTEPGQPLLRSHASSMWHCTSPQVHSKHLPSLVC